LLLLFDIMAHAFLEMLSMALSVGRCKSSMSTSKTGQTLEIQGEAWQQPLALTNNDTRCIVKSLQRHPHAVDTLSIVEIL
jgi:hypothetical protein